MGLRRSSGEEKTRERLHLEIRLFRPSPLAGVFRGSREQQCHIQLGHGSGERTGRTYLNISQHLDIFELAIIHE